MSETKYKNFKKMDRSLAKIQKQVFSVVIAREANSNAYDDEMPQRWNSFRTEVEKLQKELSKVMSCILIEDGET